MAVGMRRLWAVRTAAAAGALAAAVGPACGQEVLFDSGSGNGVSGNGGPNPGTIGWDDFVLDGDASVEEITIGLLSNFGGPSVAEVEWAIYAVDPDGTFGRMLASGDSGPVQGHAFVQRTPFGVYEVTFPTGGVALTAGRYALATRRSAAAGFAFWATTGAVAFGSPAGGGAAESLGGLPGLAESMTSVSGPFGSDFAMRLRGVPITFAGCNPADRDEDGRLSFGDVRAFIVAFNEGDPLDTSEDGDPGADTDGDGAVTFEDVSLFALAFGAGCG